MFSWTSEDDFFLKQHCNITLADCAYVAVRDGAEVLIG